jgi:hypothetical protein
VKYIYEYSTPSHLFSSCGKEEELKLISLTFAFPQYALSENHQSYLVLQMGIGDYDGTNIRYGDSQPSTAAR